MAALCRLSLRRWHAPPLRSPALATRMRALASTPWRNYDGVECEERRDVLVKRRIAMHVAYRGTAYYGSQWQGNQSIGKPTVEGVLEKALVEARNRPALLAALQIATGFSR